MSSHVPQEGTRAPLTAVLGRNRLQNAIQNFGGRFGAQSRHSPPASRGESRGCGGARLTRRNGRPRERNPSLQRGICVRHANNSIRKAAFKGELSSGASVLRVSVQQFRAVLPSSSGAAPRAEHMARCSDHRGQGPRPGPVPRAPRGLLHPRAVVEGEEAENDSGGASIAPRARPRMRVAALPSHRIDPAAPLAHTAQTRSCPNAAPALLARSLGSRARQRLHQQLPSR